MSEINLFHFIGFEVNKRDWEDLENGFGSRAPGLHPVELDLPTCAFKADGSVLSSSYKNLIFHIEAYQNRNNQSYTKFIFKVRTATDMITKKNKSRKLTPKMLTMCKLRMEDFLIKERVAYLVHNRQLCAYVIYSKIRSPLSLYEFLWKGMPLTR